MKEIHVKAKQDKITGGASSVVNNNLTASRALVSDANGKVAASSVTGTELNYLSGATSSIQTQINNKAATSDLTYHSNNTTKHITDAERTKWDGKQDAITGAATSITDSNLTPNVVMVTDSTGKVATLSSISTSELSALNNYLVGEKGNIKTRFESAETAINKKQDAITGAATTITSSNLTASRALVSNSSGKVAVSAVTATELESLQGIKSNVQTQIDDITGGALFPKYNTVVPILDNDGDAYSTTKNGYLYLHAIAGYVIKLRIGNIDVFIDGCNTQGVSTMYPIAAGVTITRTFATPSDNASNRVIAMIYP